MSGEPSTGDAVTRAYFEACETGDLAEAVWKAPFSRSFRDLWWDRLLARPLFIPETEMNRLVDDLGAYFDLLVALPERLFSGDLHQYGEAVGMARPRVELLSRFHSTSPTRFGRADLYRDGDGFKLLEFNVASDVGGIEYSEFNRSLMEVPVFEDFAASFGLGHVHTGEHLASLWREAAARAGRGDEPTVAVIGANGNTRTLGKLLVAMQEMMARLGVPLRVGEIPQVRSRGGRIELDGEPIDIVLRFFTVDDLWDDPELLSRAEVLFHAHEEDRVLLWTTLDSSLYSNKGAMGLISRARSEGAFSDRESALVDRLLPWSRVLGRGTTRCDDEEVDLFDYCRANRGDLVLKPNQGFGGQDVIAGWEVSDREWREWLTRCRGQDWIVQRRVVPREDDIVDVGTRESRRWASTWGVFLTPAGYGGSMVRGLPVDGPTVLYFGNRDARSTGVFTYPEAEIRT